MDHYQRSPCRILENKAFSAQKGVPCVREFKTTLDLYTFVADKLLF